MTGSHTRDAGIVESSTLTPGVGRPARLIRKPVGAVEGWATMNQFAGPKEELEKKHSKDRVLMQ